MSRGKKFTKEQVLDALRVALSKSDQDSVLAKDVAVELACDVGTALRYLNGYLSPEIVRIGALGGKKRRVRWTLG